MVVYDNKLDFITTIHSMTHLNFSPVLKNTSQSEFLVMCAVKRLCIDQNGNSFGVSDIAECLHVSSPAISRTISSLEKKGYVERNIDRMNRRNTIVTLTEKGGCIFSDECDRIYLFLNNVFKRMGENKLNALLELSHELLDNFNNELKNSTESH